MRRPGSRWSASDQGLDGAVYSRAAGAGGQESIRRLMADIRGRGFSLPDDSAGGGSGLMADPPPAVFSRPSQPVTVTAGSDGPVMVSITSDSDGLTNAAVTLNDGPTMWVPVVDGAGAVQLIVAVGDVIAVAGASSVDLMETS